MIAKVNYDAAETAPDAEEVKIEESAPERKERKKKQQGKRLKFDIVYAEGVAIFLLISAILLTNIFWEGSGINTIMRNTFGEKATVADARTYLNFSAKTPSDSLTAEISDGVLTLSGEGAIYPVCDGTLTSVSAVDGKYTLTVSHSDVFKTVISGLNYVYAEEGNEVYKYIPIGYVGGGDVTVSMYNDGVLLTGYVLEGGNIVWES